MKTENRPLSNNAHSLVLFLATEMWTCGVSSVRYLMALLMRFWNTCMGAVSSARTIGRGSWVIFAPLVLMLSWRLSRACSRFLAVRGSVVVFSAFACLPVVTYAFEERVHAVCSLHGVADELVRVVSEVALILLRQELGIAPDHAQGLLQVV